MSTTALAKPSVTYCGYQPGFGDAKGTHLWNLLVEVSGHPVGSSVSSEFVTEAGLPLPHLPQVGEEWVLQANSLNPFDQVRCRVLEVRQGYVQLERYSWPDGTRIDKCSRSVREILDLYMQVGDQP